jgi:biopolymer transport protein ExbB
LLSIIQAAGWPIWPLIACSILALALVIERFISLKTSQSRPTQAARRGAGRVAHRCAVDRRGDTAGAELGIGRGAGQRLPGAERQPPLQRGRPACPDGGHRPLVAHRLERYLSALATIASAAPLLGLLGTVIGMIEIFGSQSPAGGATGGNPAQLAHGISVALYNTAFGLIVAIPALIFWRYFRAGSTSTC